MTNKPNTADGSNKTTRRSVLAAGATGLGIAIAGCASSQSKSESDQTATVFTELSEEAQTRRQEKNRELSQEFRTGNVTRQEAARQSQTLQAELHNELTNSAMEKARSSGLTVDDSITQEGNAPILLVTGSESDLLAYVQNDIVVAIGDESEFADVQQQREQQQQQQRRRQQAVGNQTTANQS